MNEKNNSLQNWIIINYFYFLKNIYKIKCFLKSENWSSNIKFSYLVKIFLYVFFVNINFWNFKKIFVSIQKCRNLEEKKSKFYYFIILDTLHHQFQKMAHYNYNNYKFQEHNYFGKSIHPSVHHNIHKVVCIRQYNWCCSYWFLIHLWVNFELFKIIFL